MRVLFFSLPAHGHVLPLLPLATAARRAGHDTAVVTGAALIETVAPLQVLPVGPTSDVLMAEVARRTGGGNPGTDPTPALAAELFAGVRVDLTADDALAAAGAWAPDLIIAESVDFIGPLVAAALDIPWVAVAINLPLPPPMVQAMEDVVASRYRDRDLTPTSRMALVDPLPDVFHRDDWVPSPDRIAVRTEPHVRPDNQQIPQLPTLGHHPRVLITLGTVVDEPATLAAITDSVTAGNVDADVVVTVGPRGINDLAEPGRVHVVEFLPLGEILDHLDVVVAAGGTGTVLAALAAGLPMVVMPMVADQPWNAQRAEALGAAVVVSRPDEVGVAVEHVLANPSFRSAAAAVAAQIHEIRTADDVITQLSGLVPVS